MLLDIEQVIDNARLGGLHWRVLILCALVTLLDGLQDSRDFVHTRGA